MKPESPQFTPETLKKISIDPAALTLLSLLRLSEPQLPTFRLAPLPTTESTLYSLAKIAPVAVGGTLLPYAQLHGLQRISEDDLLCAFATVHAETVALSDDRTTSFRLGIPISPGEFGLFTYIHSVILAKKSGNGTYTSSSVYPIIHENTVGQELLLMKKDDSVVLHCGSVICAINKQIAHRIQEEQLPYTHLFSQIPSRIDYEQVFHGIFRAKKIL